MFLLYFIKGDLPWQNMKANNKEDKYERIIEVKLSTPIDDLCRGLPPEFSTMLTYCRNLKFEDKPDYLYLRNLFKDLFIKQGFEMDFVYNWNILAQAKQKEEELKNECRNYGGVIPHVFTYPNNPNKQGSFVKKIIVNPSQHALNAKSKVED